MNTLILKTAINIAIQLAIIVTGVFLFKNGKPYSNALFSVHKLTTVAYIVLGVLIAIAFSKQYGLNILMHITIVLAALSIVGLIASGGAVSLDKQLNVMQMVHKVSAIVFVLSTWFFSFKVISTVVNF